MSKNNLEFQTTKKCTLYKLDEILTTLGEDWDIRAKHMITHEEVIGDDSEKSKNKNNIYDIGAHLVNYLSDIDPNYNNSTLEFDEDIIKKAMECDLNEIKYEKLNKMFKYIKTEIYKERFENICSPQVTYIWDQTEDFLCIDSDDIVMDWLEYKGVNMEEIPSYEVEIPLKLKLGDGSYIKGNLLETILDNTDSNSEEGKNISRNLEMDVEYLHNISVGDMNKEFECC